LETLYGDSLQASLPDFVASGYLHQLSLLNDASTAIKEGNNNVAAQQLFDLYSKNFNKAISQVFKPTSENPKHVEFFYKMQANTIKFSAYKAEYFKNALVKAYEKDAKNYDANAKQILQAGNRFQITEYNTTVARARTARQFGNFQKDADLFPNLEWLPSTAYQPREEHRAFWGLILPMDDPFWQNNQPGNLYNCKCNWRQTNKPATAGPEKIVKPARGLEGNPYKTREIFTDKHPYFERADKQTRERVDSFVSEQIFKTQFQKQEGGYFVHPLQNKKASDFEDLKLIAGEFVKKGNPVYIMPKLSASKGDLYQYIYMGAYEAKQPDLLIRGLFYEYESFERPFEILNIKRMVKKGRSQSDRIIIDLKGIKISHRAVKEEIKRVLGNLKEVHILTDSGTIRLI